MKKMLFVPLCIAAFLFCGCTVISELPAQDANAKNETPEFAACKELLIAFLKNDAAAFINRLPAETRHAFREEDFSKMRENLVKSLGEPVSFRYLTTLEMTALKPNLWAVRFKRVNQQNGKEFFQEAVFRATSAEVNGRAEIIGFNFE